MNAKDQIATYYHTAKQLIKQNNPKDARGYVLLILNSAVKTYNEAKTILIKAKTAAFLDTWIAVSRDLYYKGITEYVKQCFGLAEVKNALPPEPVAKPKKVTKPAEPIVSDGEIDIAGLIDEAAKTQGWCAEVFEANKNAVVQISVSASMHDASGTGFIISDNGYLLTNDHVVFDDQNGAYYSKVNMALADDKKKHKLEVLFSDKNADVALCKFDTNEVQGYSVVNRITDYSKLKQGADCLVIGNAFGMGLAPFTGIVRFTKNDNGNLVYTAPSNPGDSGGPVFDRSGECIGINKSKTVAVNGTSAEGYANATPMDKVDELLQKWCDRNKIVL